MTGKQLTQTGLNRAMFIMLKRLGGQIAIKEHAIENPSPEDAMKVQHDPASKVFVFSLHRVRKSISQILVPGRN